MANPWSRDNIGWYSHKDYPALVVRPYAGSSGWEIVRFHKPAKFESVARSRRLVDAKRSVETEGARWTAALDR